MRPERQLNLITIDMQRFEIPSEPAVRVADDAAREREFPDACLLGLSEDVQTSLNCHLQWPPSDDEIYVQTTRTLTSIASLAFAALPASGAATCTTASTPNRIGALVTGLSLQSVQLWQRTFESIGIRASDQVVHDNDLNGITVDSKCFLAGG